MTNSSALRPLPDANSSPGPVDGMDWPAQSALRREFGALFRRRRLIGACVGICVGGATLYNFGARPLFEATSVVALDLPGSSSFQVQNVEQARRAAATWEHVQALKSMNLAHLVLADNDPDLIEELKSGPLGDYRTRFLSEAKFRLGLGVGENTSVRGQVGAFLSRLDITNQQNSGWISVSLRAYDPAVATKAINRLMALYVEEAKKNFGAAMSKRQTELQREVEARTGEVSKTLSEMSQDEKWVGMQNAAADRQLLEKQLASLQDALVQARQATLSRRVLLADVRSLSGRQMLTIPSVRSDPEISGLSGRISELEARRVRSLATLGPRHPDVVAVTEELAAAERELNSRLATMGQAIERDYRLAQNDENVLQGNLRAVEKQLAGLGPKSVEFSLLQKQSQAGERVVGELIDKSLRKDDTLFLQPRIVQAAAGAGMVSPQRSRNFLFSLGIGLGLGIAMAWLLRSLDETFATPDQIQGALGLPCLGLIPRASSEELAWTKADAAAPATLAEAYRIVRTNVAAAHEGTGSVFLLLTSTSPGEGKTTTTFGLGTALAASGDRVLLVDGDVRRATLSRRLELGSRKGLLDVARGAKAAECVYPTRFPGLDCLPAGRLDASGLEALATDGFRQRIQSLKATYRWIICDAPPVLAVADAAILCRVADEVVLVVRASQAPLRAVQGAIQQMERVGARVRGAILNAADLQADSYYYRYYYSGYYGDYGSPSRRTSSNKSKPRK